MNEKLISLKIRRYASLIFTVVRWSLISVLSFKLDARFGDVLDFVKDFDFIDVDYIVVPVNEWEHW